MTPFGEKVRELRAARGVTQGEMAKALGVSGAYLSQLEHGKRGRPTWSMLQRIIGFLHVIWDDAEELERLAELSHPKVVLETGSLGPGATAFANRLAESIALLSAEDIAALDTLLLEAVARAEAAQREARRRQKA
ncbi:helix-turn-helix transcriptional regulator [Aureimonas sp. ME7]|uniref:helix-turn-helix domain-containing protein n=1 Tax=Aureimonas sp. ME7 TaxID=2744252 RepID=UPI0015F76A2E|nr:helix-turn-helix transcriptional regulator [Aureimonas sp. ME7]